MSSTIVLEQRDPRKLKAHPVNELLYKAHLNDDDFIADVRKNGVRDPIDILPNGIIVGGHRRAAAAVAAGINYVPVIVRKDIDHKDEAEVERLLITLNMYRTKTTEEKAKEFERLLEIETAKAKGRKLENLRKNSDASSLTERKTSEKTAVSGEAASIAAEKVGLSKNTAKKALRVQKRIAQLEEEGDFTTANDLRKKLNKSVAGAAKELDGHPDQTPFCEAIAGMEWVLNVAVPRIVEHSVLAERVVGKHSISAGSAKQAASRVGTMFLTALRTAKNAREKFRQSGS